MAIRTTASHIHRITRYASHLVVRTMYQLVDGGPRGPMRRLCSTPSAACQQASSLQPSTPYHRLGMPRGRLLAPCAGPQGLMPAYLHSIIAHTAARCAFKGYRATSGSRLQHYASGGVSQLGGAVQAQRMDTPDACVPGDPPMDDNPPARRRGRPSKATKTPSKPRRRRGTSAEGAASVADSRETPGPEHVPPSDADATGPAVAPVHQQPAAVLAGPANAAAAPHVFPRRAPLTDADLDVHVPPPGHLAWSTRNWVVFSDLHVHFKTLSTCLEVLDAVLAEAVRRQAGVLFLGDWWDERGSVAFSILNPCLERLGAWRDAGVPLLMLVGNHDQVDESGEVHGLACLSGGLVHVFTGPTLFRGALWLPYRRRHDALHEAQRLAVQRLAADGADLTAVFAHADVATARYNALYQAKDGMAPDSFPSGIPVYTGHYHLPQTVPNSSITYIGSPYQVSSAERGQQKRLLVLDAEAGWQTVEEVAIDLGPKHVTIERGAKLLPDAVAALGPSAVVRLVVTPEEAKSPDHERVKHQLQQQGARVQTVVELEPGGPRLLVREDAAPQQLLDAYRAARPPGELEDDGMKLASQALQDAAGASRTARLQAAAPHVSLQLDAVQLRGFGPFVDPVEYPLAGRGLRVVTGRNEDDAVGDADSQLCSNGSGKSTLVSAALWALTGELTTRTESGGVRGMPVDGVVSDGQPEAEVVLTGRVGGKPFSVARAVKRGKGTSRLLFQVDGQDLTAQDKKGTQEAINRELCTALLRYQAFVGQNDVQALLEANDRDLKALLSQVIEMEIWDAALATLKPKVEAVRREIAEASGRLAVYREDVGRLERQEEERAAQDVAWQAERDAKQRDLEARREQAAGLLAGALDACRPLIQPLWAWWDRAARRLDATQAQLDDIMRQGTDLVPELCLPCPPTLESTRQLLAAESAPEAPSARGDEEPDGETATSAADATAEGTCVDVLRARDQELASEEEGREAHLTLAFTACEAAAGAEERAHSAAQADVARLQREVALRQQEAVGVVLGAVCEACGQPVTRDHLQRHVDVLLSQRDAAKTALDALGARLKAAREAKAGAHAELEAARAQHAVARRARHAEMVMLLQQQQDVASEKQRREMAARRAREEALLAAHAAREAQHRQTVARLQAEHAAQAAAARTVHNQRITGVQGLRDALARACAAAEQAYGAAVRCDAAAADLNDALLLARPGQPIMMGLALPRPPAHDSSAGLPDDGLHGSPADMIRDAMALEEEARRSTDSLEKVLGYLRDLQQAATALRDLTATHNPHHAVLEMLRGQLEARREALATTAALVDAAGAQQRALAEAQKALGRQGVQSFVLERVLGQLQSETGHYLSQLSDTLHLELRASRPVKTRVSAAKSTRATPPPGDGGDSDGSAVQEDGGAKRGKQARGRKSKAATPAAAGEEEGEQDVAAAGPSVVEREEIAKVVWYQPPDGGAPVVRDPAQLSGGERRRIALALLFGFSKLLRDSSRLSCNLLVLDEGLQQLDADGCRRVVDLLRHEPYDSVLVVAQAHSFTTHQDLDGVDVVVKRRGSAAVETSA